MKAKLKYAFLLRAENVLKGIQVTCERNIWVSKEKNIEKGWNYINENGGSD